VALDGSPPARDIWISRPPRSRGAPHPAPPPRRDGPPGGPFRAARTGGAAGLAGSSNQRLHFLTPRYAHLRDELQTDSQRIEVRLGADGEILVNGVVSPDALEAMLDGLACVEPPSRGNR
jgi:hypothetical protein